MLKKFSIVLMAVIITVGLSVFIIGAGDSSPNTKWYDVKATNKSYTVTTADELAGLAKLVAEGNNFAGWKIFLGTDIDLSSYEKYDDEKGWLPIGSESNPFKGSFNGNDYSVKGLKINRPDEHFIGLFGYVDGGIIEKIYIESADITGKSGIGGVVGFIRGTVRNCSYSGVIKGEDNIGGITGVNGGTISRCYNTADITASGAGIGGISGYNDNTVKECFNSGTVKGLNGVGGIAGGNGKNIENCYNVGDVIGEYNVTGGIAGSADKGSSIKYCYSACYTNMRIIFGLGSSSNIENCYYNTDLWTGIEGKSEITALNTAEMTAMNVIEDGAMSSFSTDIWVKRENDSEYSYYPELKAFGDNKISKKSVQTETPPSFEYADEVGAAKKLGLVTADLTKKYTETITREEFCELIILMYEKIMGEYTATKKANFTDTKNEAVEKAYSLGITTGVTEEIFIPDEPITVMSAYIMMSRTVKVMYDYVDTNAYVKKLENIGNYGIYTDEYIIGPYDNVTCEQAVALIYEIYMQRFESKEIDDPQVWMTTYPHKALEVNDLSQWGYVSENLDVITLYPDPITEYLDTDEIDKFYSDFCNMVKRTGMRVALECGGLLGYYERYAEDTSQNSTANYLYDCIHEINLVLDKVVRLKQHGIDIDYLNFDHPLLRAMYELENYDGDLPVISHEEAVGYLIEVMKLWREILPDVQFNFITNFANHSWKKYPAYTKGYTDSKYGDGNAYDDFIAVTKAADDAGIPFYAVIVDNPYDYAEADNPSNQDFDPASVDWYARILDIEKETKKLGLKFGIFFNCETCGMHGSEGEYYKHTMEYINKYTKRGGDPDIYFIQSWYDNPEKTFPETKEYTQSYITAAVIRQVKEGIKADLSKLDFSPKKLSMAKSWTFKNDTAGWIKQHDISTFKAEKGVLKIKSSGDDPYFALDSELNINARDCDYLLIRVKNLSAAGDFQIFFTTPS